MIYTTARVARLQWQLRSDYVFLGGCGLVFFTTDGQILNKSAAFLRNVGIMHAGGTMGQLNYYMKRV